jgi:hypothetical protein
MFTERLQKIESIQTKVLELETPLLTTVFEIRSLPFEVVIDFIKDE